MENSCFVSLDIGDGQCTASMLQANGSIAALTFDKREKVVYTQIVINGTQKELISQLFDENGDILYSDMSRLSGFSIGREAKALDKSEALFLHFKRPPCDFDKKLDESELTVKQVMTCFVYELFNQLCMRNPHELGNVKRSDITLLVGCPTTPAWTSPQNTAAYRRLILNATGVGNVMIIPESRAAIFNNIYNDPEQFNLQGGNIVFDFGSSTADCTYLLSGYPPIEFSWRLGAGEIEILLYKHFVNLHNDKYQNEPDKLISPQQSWLSQASCVEKLRHIKEEYYPKEIPDSYTLTVKGCGDIPEHQLVCDFNEMNLNYVLQNTEITVDTGRHEQKTGSWQELCVGFFLAAKKCIEAMKTSDGRPYPISHIWLTGGACNMPFIKELCREVFDDERITIHLELNPEYSVSDGLCYVQDKDIIVEGAIDDARQHIVECYTLRKHTLYDRVASFACELISALVLEVGKEWSEEEQKSSIKELDERVRKAADSPNFRQKLNSGIKEKESEWCRDCSEILQNEVESALRTIWNGEVPDSLINFSKRIFSELTFDLDPIINRLLDNLVADVEEYVSSIIGIVFVVPLAFINAILTNAGKDDFFDKLFNKMDQSKYVRMRSKHDPINGKKVVLRNLKKNIEVHPDTYCYNSAEEISEDDEDLEERFIAIVENAINAAVFKYNQEEN